MKKCFGLMVFLLSFQAFAGSKGAILMLRAFVPESYKVEFSIEEDGAQAKIISNRRNSPVLAKSFIQHKDGQYLVSIVHP